MIRNLVKRPNARKALLAIIFGTLLIGKASGAQQPKGAVVHDVQSQVVEEDKLKVFPFFVQGYFETKWDSNNFWNDDDNGGTSIGPFQIHSRYLLRPFFEYLGTYAPDYLGILNEKGGLGAVEANDKDMREVFCRLCETDENFIRVQARFIDKENFQPRMKVLKQKYGLDISARSLSIEGILRATSGNLGGRVNYVVEDMIKSLANAESAADKSDVSENMEDVIASGKLNTLGDYEFVQLYKQSLHKVITDSISVRYRDALISLYDSTIENVVLPNLRLVEELKAFEREVAEIGNDSSFLVAANMEDSVLSTPYALSPKKPLSLTKRRNDGREFPLLPDRKPKGLPPKKTKIVTVNEIVRRNKNTKPVLKGDARKRVNNMLRDAAAVLNDEKQVAEVRPSLLNRAEVVRTNADVVAAKSAPVPVQRPSLLNRAEVVRSNADVVAVKSAPVPVQRPSLLNRAEVVRAKLRLDDVTAVNVESSKVADKILDSNVEFGLLTVANIINKNPRKKKETVNLSSILAEAKSYII